MILTAQQPAYLPWLGLFHKIALADTYVSLDDVQFEKNSFTNRNKIKTANGPVWLSVPVKLKGHTGSSIREIEIDATKHWQKDHWKTMQFAYKKAPYFDRYSSFFEDVYTKEWNTINDLCDHMMRWFLKELGIEVEYMVQSEIKTTEKKQELVLELCKKLKANRFVFGKLGEDYANKEDFTKEGIEIYFQDYEHPMYQQLHGDFASHMSIPDLLFNEGDRSLEIIMQGNAAKESLFSR